jgi:hypothetical protein
MLRAGRIMSGLPALFLLMDGVMKLVKPEPVVKATVQLGYPESVILGLGIVLLACVILYLIPRTSVLRAMLLTGYLGGAVASRVGVGDPLVRGAAVERALRVPSTAACAHSLAECSRGIAKRPGRCRRKFTHWIVNDL